MIQKKKLSHKRLTFDIYLVFKSIYKKAKLFHGNLERMALKNHLTTHWTIHVFAVLKPNGQTVHTKSVMTICPHTTMYVRFITNTTFGDGFRGNGLGIRREDIDVE